MADLAKIPDVDIDPSGVFKYILVKIAAANKGESKLVVRGYVRCEYHADIFKELKNSIGKNTEMSYKCLGGGRINHEPEKKTILVYGYSQGFGRADHSKAVALLKQHYPSYGSIEYSNDGY